MKICPKCRNRPKDCYDLLCGRCKLAYQEEDEIPLPLADDDLEKIAVRVARALTGDGLDRRVTAQLLRSLKKDDWKQLSNQVFKSLNIYYHGRQVAYILLGMRKFWMILIPVTIFALAVVWGIAAKVAGNRAATLFNETVTNQINLQFRESRISNIVVSVASNEATNLLLKQIHPTITLFQGSVSNSLVRLETNIDARIGEVDQRLKQSQEIETNLQSVIDDAREAVRRLDTDSEFVTTAILADHDDRSAYEKLVNWGTNQSFRHHDSSKRVADGIQISYYNDQRPWTVLDWPTSASNRFSWTMEDIVAAWKVITKSGANDFIRLVWANTNLSKEQRISFLRNVYLKDSGNSLQAANTAAAFVSEELKVAYNPAFMYSAIEKRWLEYSTTNHLFTIPTNCPTNVVYDIIPPTSTNRVVILRDWGENKLVLFKLQYPATAGSIDGLFFKYSQTSAQKLNTWPPSYLNVVWAAFHNWEGNMIKCEFKYERDFSKTNVQTISITTNNLILDGSFQIPLP